MSQPAHPFDVPPPPMPRPGWWSRNWKWMVPVLCVGAFATLALFVFGIIALVFGAMKSSDPYKESISRASTHPEVIAALGTPVKGGFFLTGNIHTSGSSGRALLDIPVSGPKGSGSIHVEASKSGGVWSYSQLEMRIPGKAEPVQLPR